MNGQLLNDIIGSGVPEQAAKHALFQTGNNSADMAVMWYFENMDNPSKFFSISSNHLVLTQPLPKVKKAGSGSKEADVP